MKKGGYVFGENRKRQGRKHFTYNRAKQEFGEPRGENLEEAKRRGRRENLSSVSF